MKELTYEEYRVLATENVCAVTIYGDFIKAFGWIEEWNDGFELFENDPFRIVLFERDMIGNEWFISHNAVKRLSSSMQLPPQQIVISGYVLRTRGRS